MITRRETALSKLPTWTVGNSEGVWVKSEDTAKLLDRVNKLCDSYEAEIRKCEHEAYLAREEKTGTPMLIKLLKKMTDKFERVHKYAADLEQRYADLSQDRETIAQMYQALANTNEATREAAMKIRSEITDGATAQ